MIVIVPVSFYAADRDAAKAKALAWAKREPRVQSAAIVRCEVNTHIPTHMDDGVLMHAWHVDLDVRWWPEPEQEELGL